MVLSAIIKVQKETLQRIINTGGSIWKSQEVKTQAEYLQEQYHQKSVDDERSEKVRCIKG